MSERTNENTNKQTKTDQTNKEISQQTNKTNKMHVRTNKLINGAADGQPPPAQVRCTPARPCASGCRHGRSSRTLMMRSEARARTTMR